MFLTATRACCQVACVTGVPRYFEFPRRVCNSCVRLTWTPIARARQIPSYCLQNFSGSTSPHPHRPRSSVQIHAFLAAQGPHSSKRKFYTCVRQKQSLLMFSCALDLGQLLKSVHWQLVSVRQSSKKTAPKPRSKKLSVGAATLCVLGLSTIQLSAGTQGLICFRTVLVSRLLYSSFLTASVCNAAVLARFHFPTSACDSRPS